MHFAIFNFLFQFYTPGECMLKINENWNYLLFFLYCWGEQSPWGSRLREFISWRGGKPWKAGQRWKDFKVMAEEKKCDAANLCCLQRKFTRSVGCSPFGILNCFDVTQSGSSRMESLWVFWLIRFMRYFDLKTTLGRHRLITVWPKWHQFPLTKRDFNNTFPNEKD